MRFVCSADSGMVEISKLKFNGFMTFALRIIVPDSRVRKYCPGSFSEGDIRFIALQLPNIEVNLICITLFG